MLPLDRFLAFIERNQLFNSSDKILLAVSGGRDSVLMAHLFNGASFNFGIAHCNFKLRGDESEQDEAFVRQLATQLEVPFHCTSFDTLSTAKAKGISTQMAARELRYTWFSHLCEQYGYHYIAVAHHQSDTTETMLLNLVRGTGVAGMHGILAKREDIVRPLLFLERDEIQEIVNRASLAFREDSSNHSTKYARNKLRLEVIPRLKELNPSLDQTFTENAERFSLLETFLNEEVERLRKTLLEPKPNGSIELSLSKLKVLNPMKLLLFELLKPFTFSETSVVDLIRALHGPPGKTFYSATHVLLLDRDKLIIRLSEMQNSSDTYINEADKEVNFLGVTVRISTALARDLMVQPEKRFAYFDQALLQFPLKFRQWNKGDYFYPFGMRGKKKLSDFLINLKIPRTEKPNLPVLANGNGDVLWVAGYRTDDRYKITAQTKKVIIFEMQ